MSIDRGMDKDDMVHISTGIIVIKRNKTVPFAEMCIDLETVIE